MAKKESFSDFFEFHQKLSKRFKQKLLQDFYIILESYLCKASKYLDWNVRNIDKISPK